MGARRDREISPLSAAASWRARFARVGGAGLLVAVVGSSWSFAFGSGDLGERDGSARASERLREIDREIGRAPSGDGLLELRTERARLLLALGRYPEAERDARALIAKSESRVPLLTANRLTLADALRRQGDAETASGILTALLAESPSDEARRLLARIYLSERRYADAGAVADEIEHARNDDPLVRFARGARAAKHGPPELAVDDLRAAARSPEWERAARFELALAWGRLGRPVDALRELVTLAERDPFDLEVCYQVSRQLVRSRRGGSIEKAALVTRYFEFLKESAGPSSRAEHLARSGDRAGALAESAAAAERSGDTERAVRFAVRALSAAGTVEARTAAALLLVRFDLLHVASTQGGAGIDRAVVTGAVDRARARIASSTPPLAALRLAVASAKWERLDSAIAPFLAPKRIDPGSADRAAKILLAREPRHAGALRHLAERTRTPELIVPHLHFVRRLADVDRSPDRLRELDRVRGWFLGD